MQGENKKNMAIEDGPPQEQKFPGSCSILLKPKDLLGDVHMHSQFTSVFTSSYPIGTNTYKSWAEQGLDLYVQLAEFMM